MHVYLVIYVYLEAVILGWNSSMCIIIKSWNVRWQRIIKAHILNYKFNISPTEPSRYFQILITWLPSPKYPDSYFWRLLIIHKVNKIPLNLLNQSTKWLKKDFSIYILLNPLDCLPSIIMYTAIQISTYIKQNDLGELWACLSHPSQIKSIHSTNLMTEIIHNVFWVQIISPERNIVLAKFSCNMSQIKLCL